MYFSPFTLDGNWQYRYSRDQLYIQTIRCIKLKSFFKIKFFRPFSIPVLINIAHFKRFRQCFCVIKEVAVHYGDTSRKLGMIFKQIYICGRFKGETL